MVEMLLKLKYKQKLILMTILMAHNCITKLFLYLTRMISCIYRHPSQNSEEFLTKLNTRLAYVNSERKQYFILGDININTLGDNYQEMLARKYNLILKSNDCFSTITTATRITKEIKTLLDHILTNESVLEVNPGIIDYQISDHSCTFLLF